MNPLLKSKANILIVEDVPEIAEFLHLHLIDKGYEVAGVEVAL